MWIFLSIYCVERKRESELSVSPYIFVAFLASVGYNSLSACIDIYTYSYAHTITYANKKFYTSRLQNLFFSLEAISISISPFNPYRIFHSILLCSMYALCACVSLSSQPSLALNCVNKFTPIIIQRLIRRRCVMDMSTYNFFSAIHSFALLSLSFR